MRIVLISQYYWPETFGAGKWTAEVAEWLAQRGHDVTVVTAFPNYPDGIVFPGYRGRVFMREEHNGVQILRTWIFATPRTKALWQRILGQASFSCSLILGCLLTRRPDVFWYASPPLPGAFTTWLASKVKRAHNVMYVLDVEPQRSIALGLFTNRHLIRMLEWIERFVYHHYDRVCVLSESTKQWLAKRGAELPKLRIMPLWADGSHIVPLSRDSSLRNELGLNGEFVALYTGNMGYTMADLETVLDAAQFLQTEADLHFVIAGSGVRQESIAKRAEGLSNVTMLPIQPLDRFPRLLATADVGLVLLSREGTQASVPSKTYSLLAAGKPIVAICEAESDTARLLRDAQCGMQVAPADAHYLAAVLREYRDHPERAQVEGTRARTYFEEHHTPEHCMTIFESTLEEVVATK